MDKFIKENKQLLSKVFYIVGLSILALMFLGQCIEVGGFSSGYFNLILIYGLVGLVMFFAKNQGTKKFAIFALAVILVLVNFLSVQGFGTISAVFDWYNVAYGISYTIGFLISIYAFVLMVLYILNVAFNVKIGRKFFGISLQAILVAILVQFLFGFTGSAISWGGNYKIVWYLFLNELVTFSFSAYFVLNRNVLTGETEVENAKEEEKEENKEEKKETEPKEETEEKLN